MNFFSQIKIPDYILVLIISNFISGFLLWRVTSRLKGKKGNVFDLIFISIFLSIILARLAYVIQNINQFEQISWSMYPYYYIPGAQRIWFKQMPWIILKFWSGEVLVSIFPFGLILSALIFLKINNYRQSGINKFFIPIVVGCISLFFGFFITKSYSGKVTNFPFSIKYFDDNYRFPVQIFEIVVLLILVLIYKFVKDAKRIMVGIFIFTLGWLEIFMEYFKEIELSNRSSIVVQAVYGVLVLLGFFNVYKFFKKFQVQDLSLYKNGDPLTRRNKVSQSNRKFQSSYASYKKMTPSIFQFIKRKIRSFKNK